MYSPGDPVIYRVTKHSAHPGPRAKEIWPSAHGENYTYVVDKFWIVAEIRDDGKLLLNTRRGKRHVVDSNDPLLRHPHWWEWVRYRNLFPQLDVAEGSKSITPDEFPQDGGCNRV